MNTFNSVAIIGAGTMGHALALVHAIAGAQVRLYDNNESVLNTAPRLIASALETLLEVATETLPPGADILAKIDTTTTLSEAVEGAELIVEAVVEDREIKRTLFTEIDRVASQDAIVASNTSYLDIFPLVPSARQSHTLIAHWYTPPYIIDLVDLAKGPNTAPEIFERMVAYYTQIGKKPVRFERLVPGYIANRLQAAMSLEVFRMLDEGWVSAEAIDDSIRYGLAKRMALLGHLQKADFTGLDMVRRALANGMYMPPEPSGHSVTLDQLLAEGRGGVHDGAGFFDYGGRSAERLFKERDIKLLKLKQALALIDSD